MVMKSLSEAKKEGVKGFFKEFGKVGVVELVTGLLLTDFASDSFGAVRQYLIIMQKQS